jgi:hypothetical protein
MLPTKSNISPSLRRNQLPRHRLTIFMSDFREALRFADYILQKNLHEKKAEQSRLVHLAFDLSLVISYARPFGQNRERPGEGRSSLDAAVIEVLTGDEAKLHARIMDRRDRAYAHSDASMHLIEGFDYDRRSVQLMLSLLPLGRTEIQMTKGMIKKWLKHLHEQKTVSLATVQQ